VIAGIITKPHLTTMGFFQVTAGWVSRVADPAALSQVYISAGRHRPRAQDKSPAE